MGNNGYETVLLVADTHFHLDPDPEERIRLRRFLSFLEMSAGVDHLVLLGDIFDFWFDYPHFRLKGYDDLLHGLDLVRDAGTRIHFVGGNHDIWASGYFHRRYGCSENGGPLTLNAGGLRMRLIHGDGMLGRDLLYRCFRWIVRRRLGIICAKSLHPEILFAISTWLSGRSRMATRDEASRIETLAARRLPRMQGDWDLAVIGHVHHPFIVEHQSRKLAALGGWLGREGYGIAREGRFELRDFEDGPPI